MSKITSKNLSYDTTLPPFLQKLQNVNASLDGRHEYAIARPKRARDAQDVEDDAPAYVDEETNHTLSKNEYAALVERKEEDQKLEDAPVNTSTTPVDAALPREEEKIATIGAAKKRKLGRTIAGDDDDDDISKAVKEVDALTGTKAKADNIAKAKKKGKKIKLSFNEDES